ncbi:MAG: tetratricopeptide repeat protein, partial [Deltaproteobacteria bacterium]|nr:tetratricopeptide repeat protein [Deltaproteobacteria bacterium]
MPTEQKTIRKLRAILSADVKGYSLLMADNEAQTIQTLKSYRQIMFDLIVQHSGRVIDSPGDNLLAEFASAMDAVNCSVKIQEELKERNAELFEDRKMKFRIGINIGDIVQDADRIYGDGVNVAARIEGLAEPGGICISRGVCDHVKKKLKLGFEYLGEHAVKNIAEPVRVYKVLMEPEYAGEMIGEERPKPKHWRWASVASAVVLIVVAVAFAVWHFNFRPPPIEPATIEKMAFPFPEKPSIAVLPFENMSSDPKQEYFSDGITEQIITGLSNVPKLFVISRNATFTYKGKPVKPKQVAEELGVQYILEGSVQKFDERVRINAQLIDALAGHHLWAEHYDRELKDIFALQDEITIKIITAMRVKLTAGEQARVFEKATNNLSAYFKYLNAREHMDRNNKEDNVIAKKLLEETIALDPKFALAQSLLGATHLLDLGLGSSKNPKASITQAIKLTKKAIALDESLARPHALMALLYTLTKQYKAAASKCEQALALDPNDERAHSLVGTALRFAGRWEEAILVYEKAIRLNPYPDSYTYFGLGLAYCFTGQFEKAIEACQRAAQNNPNDLFANVTITAVYGMAGRNEEARDSAEKVLKIDPKFTIKSWKNILRLKNQSELKRYVEALRNAGLPYEPALPLPDKPSIAVLAFENMSEDPNQEYFSDGISEDIITALSKTDQLFVIARNSTFTYKGKPVKVKQVAQELGVRYVLEGSVRKSGNRVRITAQ